MMAKTKHDQTYNTYRNLRGQKHDNKTRTKCARCIGEDFNDEGGEKQIIAKPFDAAPGLR